MIARDIVNNLYNRLPPNGHELVAFDTNRYALLHNFLKTPQLKAFSKSGISQKLSFRLTIITNKDPNSEEIVARTKEENADSFKEVALNMRWPRGIYSLSHVAMPFPVDDPLYGTNPSKATYNHVQLGNVYMRGERNVLRISEQDLMRLRCNPFWDYVESRIKNTIFKDNPKKAAITNSPVYTAKTAFYRAF